MRIIHRVLVIRRTFWGLVKCKPNGYRFGFGAGFLEWGTGMSGIYVYRGH